MYSIPILWGSILLPHNFEGIENNVTKLLLEAPATVTSSPNNAVLVWV